MGAFYMVSWAIGAFTETAALRCGTFEVQLNSFAKSETIVQTLMRIWPQADSSEGNV